MCNCYTDIVVTVGGFLMNEKISSLSIEAIEVLLKV